MALIVRIHLVGLMATVQKAHSLTTLLLDSSQFSDLQLEPHYPCFAWRADCSGEGCSEPRLRELRRVEVDFEWVPERPGGNSRRGGKKSGSRLPAKAIESRDFDWITPMKDILPKGKSAKVDQSLLKKTSPDARLAARVNLVLGETSTCRLADYPVDDGKIHVLECGHFKSAMAEVVRHEMVAPDDLVHSLRVVAKDLDSDRTVADVELKPADGSDSIDVLISNQPKEARDSRTDHAHHFAAYYRILDQDPGVTDVPKIPSEPDSTAQFEDCHEPPMELLTQCRSEKKPRMIGNRPICPMPFLDK